MTEVPEELPGYCTDITVQKKQATRISLYVNDIFIGGFYRDVADKAGLHKGLLITPELYEQLMEEERGFRLREQVYRWLSMRSHSSGEIRKKALAKGYNNAEIERVLEIVRNQGYLNDTQFARQFAEEKKGVKNWGPVKIRAALSQKGIKKPYIDAALDGVFDDNIAVDDLFAASKAIGKKLMRAEAGVKRKKKLVDYLIRKGFPAHLVFEKSEDLINRLENEEV